MSAILRRSVQYPLPLNIAQTLGRLNDASIQALADNSCVMCMHFVTPDYITPRHGTERATVEDLVDHTEDHIAFGADHFPEKGWHWVEGAGRMSLLPNVARELVRQGYTDEEIRKVLGANLLRVFKTTWQGGGGS